MGENSKIEWTDHTFNPWIGCTKVSAGCANCYAEAMMDTRMGLAKWGAHGTRTRTSAANWRKPLQWQRKAKAEGRRYKVFCASLADILEDFAGLDDWRIDLWDLIYQTPDLDWLILTKRPERARLVLPSAWMGGEWPANVWMGASVEDQKAADERIGHLMYLPARVRFLSIEPLLGGVNVSGYLSCPGFSGIGWVIVGGESGPNARPMNPDWARSIRDQCSAAGVPFLFKQWGEWRPADEWESFPGNVSASKIGRFWANGEQPTSELMVNVGKHAAGRTLDGRTWDQFPQTEATPCA